MLSTIKDIINYVLPTCCILCKERHQNPNNLCSDCLKNLPWKTASFIRCASTLTHKNDCMLCGYCIQATPIISNTHALFDYAEPINVLINQLKFSHRLAVAKCLGILWAQKLLQEESIQKPNYIIPVPLHYKRLRERTFNQAIEITRPISQALKIPIVTTGISRKKNTKAQAMLSRKERAKNIKGAFTVTRNLTGSHVVIIDDVITTGNTITTLANEVKKAGASRIDAWCCAKAQTKQPL